MGEKLGHRTSIHPLLWSALVLALSAGGCVRNHPEGVVEVVGTDCVSCHRATYEATTSPPHPGSMPETCDDCHSTQSWHPAIGGGHPDGEFPISRGDHQGIRCQDCHDAEAGPSSKGENTDCIQCHPDAETTPLHISDGYAFLADQKNFCLTCHPSGEADSHPESKFPISRGDHRNIKCNGCHDADISPKASENVNCISSGCHPRSRADGDHKDEKDYVWRGDDPDFCRDCHKDGTRRE